METHILFTEQQQKDIKIPRTWISKMKTHEHINTTWQHGMSALLLVEASYP